MSSLQTLLAAFSIRNIPTYVLIVFIALLVVAFVYGYSKGVHKVSKMGLSWAIVGVGFVFVYKYLHAKAPFTWTIGKNKTDVTPVLWGFILLVGCVLAVLLLTAVCYYLFRPVKNSPAKKSRERRMLLEEGGITSADVEDGEWDFEEIQEEVYDHDDEIAAEERFERLQRRLGQKGILSRLGGGLCCMLNVAVVLAILASVFVFAIDCTRWGNGRMGAIFEDSIGKFALKYASKYALDFITVGIIFWFAYRGFKVGVVGLTHTLLCRVGMIAIIIFGFAIPFMSGLNDFVVFRVLIERCTALFAKMNPTAGNILGKVLAGAAIAAVGAALVWLLSWLLMKLIRNIENTAVLRAVDSTLAVVVYLALGVAVCLLFWGVLYTLDASGVFHISDTFSDNLTLSKECFSTAESFLKKFVEDNILKFKK